MPLLDLTADVVTLTAAVVDIASESHHEQVIADEVEARLLELDHLQVVRDGHTIIARTELGRSSRVVIAGHLDTVPANGNFPSRLDGDVLHGLGTCDMKGGVAIALHLAATVPDPAWDVTWVFYEAEEVAAEFNGLGRIARERPELLAADFAILMEPSDAGIEAGCQGTLRVDVTTGGERAHSARSWRGSNAIHAAGEVLARLRAYEPRRVVIDGLEYREGLNAVGISGGVAGNVIPDACTVTVNFRFAPDRDEAAALAHVQEVFDGFDLVVTDSAPGALPGLTAPAAAAFVEAVGESPRPKYGWTDVAQFSVLGVPAVNYGPGDPNFAHKANEHVPVEHLHRVERRLREWLTT
ncbi:succinyl-diaminopimelate desuccinylase [Aeromicrobium marinum DSM 15272]|uniref:Succinyl-diaminopimelate desuccinylase n=1 Tax=Aeromicrobium marinum DSM 15272 TaxID=585531 RepID=E2SDN4_9ACTN|nr:succinyl-diaminopimelate desuccinylase [Aeromicrobium marinum]EFQ82611.1 succinyl-diaminopimelate desuccinylase [Aeromicrobium marinum DSM 15272]